MLIFGVSLAALLLATAGQAANSSTNYFVTPSQLKWAPYHEEGWPAGASQAVISGDPSKPCGWILRFRMPDGYRLPVHANPDTEEATVLQGALELGIGSVATRQDTTTYPVGSHLVVAKGSSHFGWAVGDTILEVRPVCTVPK